MRILSKLWWQLVRFGFRLLYNELAFTYDIVSWVVSMGAWRCWQRAALQFLPDPCTGRVVEVAHGTGNLHLDLHEAGYSVIGIDLSPYMGQIAKRKFENHRKKACLVRAQAAHLPFESNTIQSIVCTFPTSFIFAKETLQEFNRILVKNGSVVVVLNGEFVGRGLLRTLLEWTFRITGQRRRSDHKYELELDIENLLIRCGFDQIVMHQVDCPRSVAQVLVVSK